MSDLSGMVNHRKNDSQDNLLNERRSSRTNEVKQNEDEARRERIHLTLGRMDTGSKTYHSNRGYHRSLGTMI